MAQEHYNENYTSKYSQKFLVKKILFEKKSRFQHIVIFQNEAFGRVLVLDGIVQTTQMDEFIYHEMFAHIPLFAHNKPASVLIIGGGDGGLLREVLRHDVVTEVDMVEIDEDVVNACNRYMPTISKDAYSDPRTNLVIADAMDFIKETTKKYDVILADTTDPVGPSEILFSEYFFKECCNHLHKNGIFVNQCGIPFLSQNNHRKVGSLLSDTFGHVAFYQAAIPTYIGGPMVFAIASNDINNIKPDLSYLKKKYSAWGKRTLCYSPEFHISSFCLPNYMNDPLWLKLRG